MSLSWRLAFLTVLFVLLAEVFIFVPSVARYRLVELQERIDDAALVAEALVSTGASEINAARADRLLSDANVLNIAITRDDRRELLLTPPQTLTISRSVDLDAQTPWTAIRDLAYCFSDPDSTVIRVVGRPNTGVDYRIETTIFQRPLCRDIYNYGVNIFALSVVISVIVAVLLFVFVQRLLVRPMLHVTRSMKRFRPSEGASGRALIEANSGVPELRDAEAGLREMQERVLAAIAQRERLANLGESLAKIQHDLRNMLSTAQLVADSLGHSHDPRVRASAPRLVRAISRANTLAEQVLEYGKAGERKPKLEDVWLDAMIEDIVATEQALAKAGNVDIQMDVQLVHIVSDEEFLSRIIHNLVRNSLQALASQEQATITITTHAVAKLAIIQVRDNGPGVPDALIDGLFEPFRSSDRKGGTGLGLAIVRELSTLVGGEVRYAPAAGGGACFELAVPIAGRAGGQEKMENQEK